MAEVAKELDRIKDLISSNLVAGRGAYDGLTSSEIGAYNRSLMFGSVSDDIEEEDWDEDWWKMIVD